MPPPSLKQGFTDETDSFDGLLSVVIFTILFGCVLTGWSYFVRKGDFDFEKFGNGIAVIAGAGGCGYGAKRLGEKYGNRDSTSNS